jgi:hypothetical protein
MCFLCPLQLVNMQHALDALKDKPDVKPKDVRSYRQKLAEIDAHYHEGRYVHRCRCRPCRTCLHPRARCTCTACQGICLPHTPFAFCRFEVHKSFPEGQAIVADLLAKTHDTVSAATA